MITAHGVAGYTSAVAQIERVSVVSLAVSRFAAVAILLLADVSAPSGDLTMLTAYAGLEGAVLVGLCWQQQIVRRRWIAPDLLLLALVLVVSASVLDRHLTFGNEAIYSYVLFSSLAAGLPTWPVIWPGVASVVLGATAAWAQISRETHPEPSWNAIPNGLGIVGTAMLTAAVMGQLRRTAEQTDRTRAESVVRAGDLATERERARYGAALRDRILATLEAIQAPEAIADARIRSHLAVDAAWLREHIDALPTTESANLQAALVVLAGSFSDRGLRITLELAERVPPLAPERVDALSCAVREAMVNISKHAGVEDAVIRLSATNREVVVEVIDGGRGFDPTTARRGFGIARSLGQRMHEIGGRVEIVSSAGLGATVRLCVPVNDASVPSV